MFPIRDHNPSDRIAYVTYALIAVNVLIYLWGLSLPQNDAALVRFYEAFAMVPAQIGAGHSYSTLATSMFLHADFMHLAGNMLFLWIFGDNVEDLMGHVRFLLFYLGTGICADLAQFAADPSSTIPTIGASGAIAGVMGAYLLFFPRARVDVLLFFIVFFRIIPIPAWIMLGLWFGLQLFSSVGSDTSNGGVAYWAHSGGFAFGVLGALPTWLRLGARDFWRQTAGRPPHPEARYPLVSSRIPKVRRR